MIRFPSGKTGRKPKYPFAAMQVGEVRRFKKAEASRIRNAAVKWGKANGRTFRTEVEGAYLLVGRVA